MIETIETFLDNHYQNRGSYPLIISIPSLLYCKLEVEAKMRSMPIKPEPPKYLSKIESYGGFFSSHYSEGYVYNFNDPLYIKELENYEIKLKEWKSDYKQLKYNTPFGQVLIQPAPYNQTEIRVIE